MIIHIGGPPGCGKSTLLNTIENNDKLKDHYKLIDLDDLGFKIMLKFKNVDLLKKEFQITYQNKIIEINKKYTNVIYIGMHFPDPRMELNGKEVFIKPFELELFANKKYCLNPGIDTIVKQFLIRHIIKSNILKEKTINVKNIINDTKYWINEYKKRNYKMLSAEKIVKLL